MGGKNDEKVSSQVNEPWSGVRDYLKGAYKDAQKLYGGGAPQYYPRNQIAPMSGYTSGALDSMAQRGRRGSPLMDSAQGMMGDTVSGDFLRKGNPYLKGAIGSATRPIVDQYTKTVIPGLDSAFSLGGRYGGGIHELASGEAYGSMMDTVGDVSSNMAYENYGDERQRMIQSAGLSPMLANQDYVDIDALGKAGMGFDNYNQSKIDADMKKWDFGQNREMDFLRNYLGLLNGASSYGTQSISQPGPNPFTSTFGGAMTGFGFGGWPGALLGGGAGLLGSLF